MRPQQCYYHSSSDVTLANDDGLNLGAHKFIFESACLMLYIQSFHIVTYILFDKKFLKFAKIMLGIVFLVCDKET